MAENEDYFKAKAYLKGTLVTIGLLAVAIVAPAVINWLVDYLLTL